jgi:ABC-type transport system involved in multi-copper enzyme maturation permease subunit
MKKSILTKYTICNIMLYILLINSIHCSNKIKGDLNRNTLTNINKQEQFQQNDHQKINNIDIEHKIIHDGGPNNQPIINIHNRLIFVIFVVITLIIIHYIFMRLAIDIVK